MSTTRAGRGITMAGWPLVRTIALSHRRLKKRWFRHRIGQIPQSMTQTRPFVVAHGYPSKHETLTQSWIDVGTPSATLGQHESNIGSTPLFFLGSLLCIPIICLARKTWVIYSGKSTLNEHVTYVNPQIKSFSSSGFCEAMSESTPCLLEHPLSLGAPAASCSTPRLL